VIFFAVRRDRRVGDKDRNDAGWDRRQERSAAQDPCPEWTSGRQCVAAEHAEQRDGKRATAYAVFKELGQADVGGWPQLRWDISLLFS
jgi:hypothetical protein